MDKKQKITAVALIISIIGLSIGFAAFSNNLTISSGATVNPDASNFKIVFANNTNVSNLDVGPVQVYNGASMGATGTPGTINNEANDGPALTGLSASFTRPGQEVIYKVNVVNAGKLKAYLKEITFGNKSCSAVETGDTTRATDSLVREACEGINVFVEIDEMTIRSSQSLNNMELDVGAYKELTIRLSYPGSASYVDGPMNVTFGDITINAKSIGSEIAGGQGEVEEICEYTESNAVNPFSSTCTYSDLDSSGSITLGDKVMCGNEGFYVIETPTGNTVNMLTEWNLNVKDPNAFTFKGISFSQTYCENTIGYQDRHVRGDVDEKDPNNLDYLREITIYGSGSGSGGSGSYYGSGSGGSGSGNGTITDYLPYGTMAFDSASTNGYGYWAPDYNLNTSVYTGCSGECNYYSGSSVGGYPAYVYDSNSTIKPYVDRYVNVLNSSVSGANATGRLIKVSELEALGCSMSGWTCSSAPAWVYQTSYWSGSAYNNNYVWYMNSDGKFGSDGFDNSDIYGVRPVITISNSVIQAS